MQRRSVTVQIIKNFTCERKTNIYDDNVTSTFKFSKDTAKLVAHYPGENTAKTILDYVKKFTKTGRICYKPDIES